MTSIILPIATFSVNGKDHENVHNMYMVCKPLDPSEDGPGKFYCNDITCVKSNKVCELKIGEYRFHGEKDETHTSLFDVI